MNDEGISQSTSSTLTRERLAYEIRHLGVQQGMTLIVHSSLRSLGRVEGGPEAVVQALMDAVTETGTLVMPTHTANYSDPTIWKDPELPQEVRDTLYEAMPAFQPESTPSYRMGVIAETFRTSPGVLRSTHPQTSFAAWGRHARLITEGHELAYSLGEKSPLARLYDLKSWILLLGVSYETNTSFHLAEYRVSGRTETRLGSPVYENGERIWKHFSDIEIDPSVFAAIGDELEQNYLVKIGKVGQADCRLLPQRLAVDFAVEWLNQRASEERREA